MSKGMFSAAVAARTDGATGMIASNLRASQTAHDCLSRRGRRSKAMNTNLPNRSKVRPTTAQRIAWITQALAKLTSARADLRRARSARAAALASLSIRNAAELRAYLESLEGAPREG